MKDLKEIIKSNNLRKLALTHRSWSNEKGLEENNERLEFLGDSVLSLVVSEYLYRTFPNFPEGELARMRGQIVSMNALSRAARKLSLGDKMLLCKGEAISGGSEKNSILADVFEAILGAVYIEKGLEFSRKFILENLGFIIEEVYQKTDLRDAKTTLQEFVQHSCKELPRYEIVREEGPDHEKWFVINVLFSDGIQGSGEGPTKKIAQQNAAAEALERLEKKSEKK